MITRERIEEILKETDVLQTGHFLLTSGRHADRYMQCAKILQYPGFTGEVLENVAKALENAKADLVVAPAIGGILVAYELARQLKIKNLFAEREDGKMTLRRGFSIPQGARVIVAEDVVTTGGTVFEVIELVKALGGVPVGVALIVDRSGGKVDFGIPAFAAYTAEILSFDAEDCPLCKNGLPVVKPGSRRL